MNRKEFIMLLEGYKNKALESLRDISIQRSNKRSDICNQGLIPGLIRIGRLLVLVRTLTESWKTNARARPTAFPKSLSESLPKSLPKSLSKVSSTKKTLLFLKWKLPSIKLFRVVITIVGVIIIVEHDNSPLHNIYNTYYDYKKPLVT